MNGYNSSFYADGFRDGEKGAKFSPPAGPNVNAQDYARGYDAGANGRLFDAGDLAGDPTRNASITRDQLTAELNSPLTRHNRRRKLRGQSSGASLWQDPEQTGLF